ncbi:MAG: outer membrane beta-barrel protein [Flavobacteriales bacterium]|nr:outer membrane beta-barrel protein [Flavobacteriales bacterium]MBK6754938.1 outer membrane beta-barrel protein [Flavobacteriales bacterium]MBK7753194.1 outer membrane beta-barrel protein [Flavobacteriales bacterium]MBK9074950.1 outer membrane beta-barrel protein [Flavobacteriales bacterium]MBK9540191.1 outer membrane beta-barrel protein [Flavobacteriales bacterium]
MLQRLFNRSLLLVAFAALGANTQAQYAWDIGVHLGGANYLGEMGGKEQTRRDFIWDMKLSQTRWAIGVFARRKLNRSFSLNAGLMYFRIQGADALSTNPQRVGRNLNFRNDMFELYLRPEFTIFQDNDIGGRGRYRTDFRLFIYAGAALYYSNPKGQLNREGAFYALRPLTTELNNYSPLGFAIPAGVGMHITKKRRHRFGFDFGYRTTFSDYIDDVSTDYQDPSLMPGGIGGLADQLADQHSFVEDGDGPIPSEYQYGWETKDSDGKLNKRGDPTHNDSYLMVTLTYSYVLKGQSNFYRQRYSWIRGKKRIGRKSRAKF